MNYSILARLGNTHLPSYLHQYLLEKSSLEIRLPHHVLICKCSILIKIIDNVISSEPFRVLPIINFHFFFTTCVFLCFLRMLFWTSQFFFAFSFFLFFYRGQRFCIRQIIHSNSQEDIQKYIYQMLRNNM